MPRVFGPLDWVGTGLAVLIAAWFARYAWQVFSGRYRHPKGAKRVWWIPGGGTHGAGQVPPLPPEPADED